MRHCFFSNSMMEKLAEIKDGTVFRSGYRQM